MPKVYEEYFQKKKEFILDVAFKICMKKPIYSISMKDIIRESGLSQGGIYKYFENVDDVIINLINYKNKGNKIKGKIDKIFDSNYSPENTLFLIFDCISTHIENLIFGYEKIYHEFGILRMSDPMRYFNIQKRLENVSDLEYLSQSIKSFIIDNVNSGHFNPIYSTEKIFLFLETSLNGAIHTILVEKYDSKHEELNIKLPLKEILKMIFDSLLFLLTQKKFPLPDFIFES